MERSALASVHEQEAGIRTVYMRDDSGCRDRIPESLCLKNMGLRPAHAYRLWNRNITFSAVERYRLAGVLADEAAVISAGNVFQVPVSSRGHLQTGRSCGKVVFKNEFKRRLTRRRYLTERLGMIKLYLRMRLFITCPL